MPTAYRENYIHVASLISCFIRPSYVNGERRFKWMPKNVHRMLNRSNCFNIETTMMTFSCNGRENGASDAGYIIFTDDATSVMSYFANGGHITLCMLYRYTFYLIIYMKIEYMNICSCIIIIFHRVLLYRYTAIFVCECVHVRDWQLNRVIHYTQYIFCFPMTVSYTYYL